MIGIYKITNNINEKCYIGQSKDIEARWKKHISVYNNKTAPNYKLYRAMRKYGLASFRFEVIEECEPEELNSREIYWIQYYDSFLNGYNMTLGGEACNGTNDKEIYQYTLLGELIKKYNSAHEADRETGIPFTNICKVCRGERKTAGGYYWSYTNEPIKPIKTITKHYTPVVQYTKDGEYVAEYTSAKEAQRETGIFSTVIGKVCKGQGKTAGGYIWKYKEQDGDLLNE